MGQFLGIPGSDWAGMGIQFGLNQLTAKQQFERQKKMMNIQFGNQQNLNKQQYERQRLLNQQGKDLSLQQWKDTNYPAQMKMLRAAGLNPALLYGMGGAGGSTAQTGSGGTATSGTAGSGNTQKADPMDIAQLSLLSAQRDKLRAETAQIKGDTKDPRQSQLESESNIAVNEGRVTLMKSEEELNKTAAALNKSKTQTEHTIRALNSSLTKLNDKKTQETVNNTKLSQATLDWMKETGLHPNDSAIGKTVQYLSEQLNVTQQELILIIGGMTVLREIIKIIPGYLKTLNKPLQQKGPGQVIENGAWGAIEY